LRKTSSRNNAHWSEGSLLGSKISSSMPPLVAHHSTATRFPTSGISPTFLSRRADSSRKYIRTWETVDPAQITVTCISDYWWGLDLLHLYTELLTTSNTAISLIYALYSSPLHTLGFSVFTSRILATGSLSVTTHKSHGDFQVSTELVTFDCRLKSPPPPPQLFAQLTRDRHIASERSQQETPFL
jgi:hypothetical protein